METAVCARRSRDVPRLNSVRSTLELEAEIGELAGHLNSANHRLLALIAEYDARAGWAAAGAQSCAHWLHWKCGIDLGAAREKVRVALALRDLPRVSAAMGRGELSYSKVRALTRAATPETEELFLSIALHGNTHHVETTVRCFRRAQEAQELSREARQQAGRRLSYCYDEDGSLSFRGTLPAEAGALFVKAIEAAIEAHERRDGSAETSTPARATPRNSPATQRDLPAAESPTPGERPALSLQRADALSRIAESFLAHGAEVSPGGDRHQIVVHVDAQTLREGGPGRCEHEHGPALPIETARRLGCDASVIAILEGEAGEPLNVGRKMRTIPPALRRALHSRDRGCRFPGCPNRHYVDGHHIRHWAHGGETRLSNLALLCRFHHRLVHEGGVTLQTLDEGALRFILPDGRTCDSPLPARPGAECGPPADDVLQGDWTHLLAAHDALQIMITPQTAVTRWRGESMDYGTATEALLYRTRNAHRPDVSAETSTPAAEPTAM
jgi:uncharacterized protein DUF222/HNH endonuclease